jgi:hypothetical protein
MVEPHFDRRCVMSAPFSAEDFFRVFVDYNTSVWPAQIVLNIVALAAVALAFPDREVTRRVLLGILAGLWLWMGIVYHWTFFADINPAARAFAVVFVLQAGLLAWLGMRRRPPVFRPSLDPYGIAGGFLIAYALILYPMLGALVGHAFPAQPTFGLPCPTTIFTIGLLVWATRGVPWPVLLVPALWSVLGISAVVSFGVLEDAMLPIAGLGGGALVMLRGRAAKPASARGPARAASAGAR